jgi:hypothetical protein
MLAVVVVVGSIVTDAQGFAYFSFFDFRFLIQAQYAI